MAQSIAFERGRELREGALTDVVTVVVREGRVILPRRTRRAFSAENTEHGTRESDLAAPTPVRTAIADTHVTLSTATPLRDAYLWYDGAFTLVILSERVRERVELFLRARRAT